MDKTAIIKVGLLIAYDWELLKNCLPRIYKEADIICMALDKNRLSWAGNKFEFDEEAFYSWVKLVDVDNKMHIYEDNFVSKKLNSRENCNLHRTMLAEFMGEGGWHIQVDSDEYFLDFAGFVKELKDYNSDPKPTDKPLNYCCTFIPIIKKVEGGYLYVYGKKMEFMPIATNRPKYERARGNGYFNRQSNSFIVHETRARKEEDLWFKLNNWGHASEELLDIKVRESHFNLWKALDKHNYNMVHNFHDVVPELWPEIKFCEGENIDELIANLIEKENFNISSMKLMMLNSKTISRIRYYTNRLFK